MEQWQGRICRKLNGRRSEKVPEPHGRNRHQKPTASRKWEKGRLQQIEELKLTLNMLIIWTFILNIWLERISWWVLLLYYWSKPFILLEDGIIIGDPLPILEYKLIFIYIIVRDSNVLLSEGFLDFSICFSLSYIQIYSFCIGVAFKEIFLFVFAGGTGVDFFLEAVL